MRADSHNNRSLSKVLAINNLLSIAINCAVIATAVALVVAIDALTGAGMGFDILAVPAAIIAYVYLGQRFLSSTPKHLWASVMGSLVFVVIISSLASLLNFITATEMLVVMLLAGLLPSAFMYAGLRVRVKQEHESTQDCA
ncbi:MAG: hypothetical protein FWF11_04485 [Coriobacteriia bacterium]|nr:hypothetical protein [Coriobacteriia bacterium]